MLAWTSGLVGTAVAAFITAYATALGNTAASPSTAPPPPGRYPLLVTVGNVAGDDPSFALPKPVVLDTRNLDHLAAEQGDPSSGYAAWLSAHHAAFVGQVHIQLVVQGNRHHLVRIINITPVESCSAPLHGTMFFFPGQSGDLSAQLYVDLDNPLRPTAYASTPSVRKYPNYFGRYSVSLGFGEQYTFQVAASTLHQYCEFKLVLTVVDDGKTVMETVNDHGQPFRLTSLPEHHHHIVFQNYQVLYLNAVSGANVSRKPSDFSVHPWERGNPKTFRW